MLLRANSIRSSVLSWRLPLRWYRRLTLVTAFSIWMLIVLGGLVRVTDSGTGCGSDWPMCYGGILPHLEYHELIEWNHRLFATLGGFLMMVTIGSTLLWYRQPRRLLWMAILAGVTYIAQAILGGITVLLNLDQTWIAAHMGNSMILLAAVVLLATFSRIGDFKFAEKNRLLRWLSLGTLLWTYVALFTGSAVVGADADLACNAWPQCSNTQLLPDNLDGWINFGHRMAVGFSDVLMLLLVILIWRYRRTDKRLMRATHSLGALYIGQVFLGAFTIWLGAPAYLKGAHLSLAAATWAALVLMVLFIWIGPKVETATKENNDTDQSSTGGGRGLSAWTRGKRKAAELTPQTVRNYLVLMRPGVIPLLLIPTIASMLIAAVQHPIKDSLWGLVWWTSLGGILATGGAHVLNQYLDRDIDARMKRTKRRPIVTGLVSPRNALIFGIVLTIVAVLELWIMVNPLAAMLSLGGNLFYVFVYTMWLKRTSAQNIVIGGAAGAVPPLVGWAAVTGSVELPAILFFAIIFFWTPAHFWALALVRHEEYAAAGVPMLPVVKGESATRRGILEYAILLLIVTLIPFAVNALSWLYVITALVLGVTFVYKAVDLIRVYTPARAWKLFKFSNNYLALLYLVMVVDRLLALGGVS